MDAAKEEMTEAMKSEIDLPEIKKLEGNFTLDKNGIEILDVFCKDKSMRLQIAGRLGFDRTIDITVGFSFTKNYIFRTARQILLPVTIGLDLAANSFELKIQGTIDNPETHVQVQPLNWLNAILPTASRANPNKYSLEKLWDENGTRPKKSKR